MVPQKFAMEAKVMAHNCKKLFCFGVTRYLSDTAKAVCGSGAGGLKPYSEIPGPRQLPFIGNGRQMAANSQRFWLYLHDGFDKYGDIYRLNVFGKLSMASCMLESLN